MTRYPRSGKGTHWTVREFKAIPETWKGDTISDGDGLFGDVRVAEGGAVSVRFKYAFKWQGKVSWHQCGTWPTTSLETIRDVRDTARRRVKEGINPNDQKRAARIEAQTEVERVIAAHQAQQADRKTVHDLFTAWIENGVARKDGNKELLRRFNKDVLPILGNVEVRKLTEGDIVAVLRSQLDRGVARMADSTFNDISQMLKWAEVRQPWRGLLIEGNPAKLVSMDTLLPLDYEEERCRVLTPGELLELDTIFNRMRLEYSDACAGSKYEIARPLKRETELSLWICLSTLCRIGELLMAEWKHIDLKNGTWFIPRSNVKGRRQKKQDHRIFLSSFALSQFTALHTLTGETRWCFPGRNKKGEDIHVCVKSVSKQVGDRQIQHKSRTKLLAGRRNDNTLVLTGGAWTPHDLRRTGATMMQRLAISLDVIDRCQNHVLAGSKVRRHYLHYEYETETRDAWERLGTQLANILARIDVAPAFPAPPYSQ